MAYSDNFPATRPVFMADFANGGKIDPRATFARSDTPPTYAAPSAVHFWSNEKHLSSENLIAYSNDISTKTLDGVTETGGQTAPDGGTDAYKLTENSATSDHRFYEIITQPGTAITFSAHFKYIGRQWVNIRLTDGSGSDRYVWFDIQNGATGTAHTGYSNVSISSSGNGYYKCSATLGTSGVGGTRYLVIAGASADNSTSTYAGSGADAFAVWGIQVSSTGETVLNETSGSIHRSYAPSLKSVATAGQPRFEYDPTDGQSEGILIEGQSTNLALYSEQFGSGSYNAFRLHVDANSAIAPDGTLTADTLRENDAASNTHGLYQDIAVSGTTAHTVSFYAKAAGRNHLAIRFDATNGVFGDDWVYFNLSTGAVGAKDADITASIESCGNGWYRCIATRTALAAATGRVVIYLADADNSSAYTGNSYSGVLAWGFSFEANSFASSYLKTEAATVTRAADSLSADLTEVGYTGGDFTVIAEANMPGDNVGNVVEIGDGTSSNRATLQARTDGSQGMTVSNAGATQAYIGSTTVRNAKRAIRVANDNFGYCESGGAVAADATGVVPVASTLYLGKGYSGSELNGTLKRVALYSEALSDTNLQAVTS